MKKMINCGEPILLLMDNVSFSPLLRISFYYFLFLVITGQNPASAHDFGVAILNALNKK